MSEGLKTDFTVDATGFVEGVNKAIDSMKEMSKSVGESIEGITSAFKSLTVGIAEIGAIAAGGKMFEGMIEDVVSYGMEVRTLGRRLGMSAEDASVLDVALRTVGVSSDSYIQVATKLSMQIAKGSAAFKAMGIETTDASTGRLLPMGTIMQEVTTKLGGMAKGTDQMTAAAALLGKGSKTVFDLLKLTSPVMEQARQDTINFGLSLGQEGVQQMHEYEMGLHRLELGHLGVKVAIVQNLLPTLMDLQSWFIKRLPDAIATTLGVINWIKTGFIQFEAIMASIGVVVGEIADNISAWFEMIGSQVKNLGKGFSDFFTAVKSGDFAGMKAAFANAMDANVAAEKKKNQAIEINETAAAEDLKRIWKEAQDEKDALLDKKKPAPTETDGGGAAAPKVKVKQRNDVAEWRKELADKKDLEENWFSWSTAQELEFWQGKLALVKGKGKEYENDIRTAESEVVKNRKKLQQEEIADAIEHVKAKEVVALGAIAAEEAGVNAAVKRNEITEQQALPTLIALEQQKLEIKKKALAEQMALEVNNKKALDALRLQGVKDTQATEAAITKLKATAEAERLAEVKATTAQIQGIMMGLVSQFEKGIGMMLKGQLSFSQAMLNAIKLVGQAFGDFVLGMVNDFIKGLAKQAAEWVATNVLKVTSTSTSSATTTVVAKQEAFSAGAAYASEAAVAAAASVAGTPFIGPALALAAYAETYDALMGLLSVGVAVSAAGGYDIPSGMNPLVQAHAEEMVLPAPIANTIRDMTSQNQGGNAGAPNGRAPSGANITIHAMDGASVKRVLSSNSNTVAKVVKSTIRDGKLRQGR